MPRRIIESRIDRLDAGLMRSHTTGDGFLFLQGRAAKPGIYHYLNEDGSIRRELIDSDVLHHPDSLGSLGGKPVTLGHPQDFVTPQNAKGLVVGSVDPSMEIEAEGGYVRIKMVLHDADAIDAVRSGDAVELSMGYRAVIEMEGGTHDTLRGPDGTGEYDAVQRWRGPYNHAALVERGRHGATVRVRADAVQRLDSAITYEITADDTEPPMNRAHLISLILAAATIDAMTADEAGVLADALLPTYDAGDPSEEEEEDDRDNTIERLKAENATLREKVEAMKGSGENDDVADFAGLLAQAGDALPEGLEAWRADRMALLARVGDDAPEGIESMTNDALRRHLVTKAQGDAVKDAPDVLILAHWQIMQRDGVQKPKATADGLQGVRDAFRTGANPKKAVNDAENGDSNVSFIDLAEAKADSVMGGMHHATPKAERVESADFV